MNSHIKFRHPLGALLNSKANSGRCGIVIGTWRWAQSTGPTRKQSIGTDPRSDDSSMGYLVLPLGERVGYYYFLYGDIYTLVSPLQFQQFKL